MVRIINERIGIIYYETHFSYIQYYLLRLNRIFVEFPYLQHMNNAILPNLFYTYFGICFIICKHRTSEERHR